MSWFYYKDQTKRGNRKGIWLRVRALPPEILSLTLPYLRTEEEINWVEVKELQHNNHVLLEFWCQTFADRMKMKSRFNVFHLSVKENPEWVCEGDLGRGFVKPPQKSKPEPKPDPNCPLCEGEGVVHDAIFEDGDSDQQMHLMQDTTRRCSCVK